MGTRNVAIDWAGLERALTRHSRESEAYLDTRTGDIVYVTRGWSNDHDFSDAELDEGLVSGRLVPIEPLPAETERGWMTTFAESLEDGWARDALCAALKERSAIRRFEDALGFFPAERRRWLTWREERVQAVVRAWLVASDVDAGPPASPGTEADGPDHGGASDVDPADPANGPGEDS
jgi:hypothetical protein